MSASDPASHRGGGGQFHARRREVGGQQPSLLALVERDERGDPMSPLRWTTKSLRIDTVRHINNHTSAT
ncbi:hypothetical protein [Streptomyces turgidiscabies]|uniref:hypothetical protein n=1 Tax=Streptomyces turgidiscabies TaxID=85558 RepID=UPI0027D8EBEF|nr:hypothetical protein [Streptomyces turgidiscabies]